MKEIKNVLLCGLGAIGSIYAVNIDKYDKNSLKVLVDASRINKYKASPLIFNGEEKQFNYITDKDTGFCADLIIIATKNNALPQVIQQVRPFVAEDTIFISLLNGLKSEEILAEAFGGEHILYSYFIGHASMREGRHITHDGVYKTVFGKKDNTVYCEDVLSVKSFFDKAGINYDIPQDMLYSMWWKFLVNVGYNQASAVLDADYGAFQNSQKANDIAIKLMEEAVLVAKAQGVQNTENLLPEVLEILKTMIPETKTSMLQDVLAKRQTEADVFAGYVSELAKKYSISTPYNDMFFTLLSAIDEKNMLSK